MSRERLRETLSELHEELGRTDAGDAEARERVRAAAEALDAWLDDAEAESPEGSLNERLQEALARFEGEHPTLAGALRRVVDALADLGI